MTNYQDDILEMKTYSVSAETSTRILKNWIVEAKDKDDAFDVFKNKSNLGCGKISNLKITEK